MDRVWIVVALLAVLGIGFASVLRLSAGLERKAVLAREYLEKLQDYWNSRGQDYAAYGWMTHRSSRLQRDLGALGIYASFRPPHANYLLRNVPAVFTLLPELRNCLDDEFLRNTHLAGQYFSSLQEMLIRHAGSLADRQDSMDAALRNPIAWFREGAREVVALPVALLGWLGIISTTTVDAIVGAAPYKFLAGLAALLGFTSAVVGLVTGWSTFLQIVSNWIGRL